jgi:hypothetical protein
LGGFKKAKRPKRALRAKRYLPPRWGRERRKGEKGKKGIYRPGGAKKAKKASIPGCFYQSPSPFGYSLFKKRESQTAFT